MPEATPPIPRLRFPEFRDDGPWEVKQLGKLVKTITPPKKIQTSGYLRSGRFPIIDQSPNSICGWTDDAAALVDEDFPLVVFGDHSCVVKLAEGPFAQGADGIKILAPLADIEARFLFWYLQAYPIEQRGYRRHYSSLKEKLIPFPSRETGEQQKIADCLTSLDALILAEQEAVAALRAHKRGLMQQLFPALGETIPRARFPEFRDAGPWRVKRLGDIADSHSSLTGKSAKDFGAGKARFITYMNVFSNPFANPEIVESVQIKSGENQTQVKAGDVFFTVSSETPEDVGMSSVLVRNIDNCYLNSFCTIYRPRCPELLQPMFSGYYFRSAAVRDHFTRNAQGATRYNLSRKAFDEAPVLIPEEDEQRKISGCLTSLDDLISAADELITGLNLYKLGLLRGLFPWGGD